MRWCTSPTCRMSSQPNEIQLYVGTHKQITNQQGYLWYLMHKIIRVHKCYSQNSLKQMQKELALGIVSISGVLSLLCLSKRENYVHSQITPIFIKEKLSVLFGARYFAFFQYFIFLFLKPFLQGQSWQFLHVQKFLLLYASSECSEYRRKSLKRSFSTGFSS